MNYGDVKVKPAPSNAICFTLRRDSTKTLLPLREKVSAKPTDEGSHQPFRIAWDVTEAGEWVTIPRSARLRVLPQGEQERGRRFRQMTPGRPGDLNVVSDPSFAVPVSGLSDRRP